MDQWLYSAALAENGLHAEVVRRFESGRFAVNKKIISLYVHSVARERPMSDADASLFEQRLLRAFEMTGGVSDVLARQAAGGSSASLGAGVFSASGGGGALPFAAAPFPPPGRSGGFADPFVVEVLPTKMSWRQFLLKVFGYAIVGWVARLMRKEVSTRHCFALAIDEQVRAYLVAPSLQRLCLCRVFQGWQRRPLGPTRRR
jgi:hypothetical protein